MKGIIFTEFIEFVEDTFGFEMSEAIISSSNLKSEGVYTAVGTYDFSEMQSLLINLHKNTKIPLVDLLETFGKHLFYQFVKLFPHFIDTKKTFFEFLSGIDHYIHIEVLKLYPDAELPRIIIQEESAQHMQIIYQSERRLASFAMGMFQSAAEYYNEPINIHVENLNEEGTEVKFMIQKVG